MTDVYEAFSKDELEKNAVFSSNFLSFALEA